MPYVSLRDVDIFYEDMGLGETILFLHSGYSRGLLAFSGQIQPFSGTYRCLFPDFRGHGRTHAESLIWNNRMIADDMAAFLKALNVEKAHLFGYSTGGGVALYLAAAHPEMVKTVTTIGCGGELYPEGSEDWEPEALLRDGKLDMIEKTAARHAEAHRGDWKTYMHQEVLDWQNHPDISEDEWNKLTMPMLFIAGSEDYYATPERLGRMKAKCPQAEIMVVEGSGHRPHMPMEHCKEVNLRVMDFMEKNSGI